MYNSCYDCRAKILIYPGDIHPDIISQFLGVIPTEKGVKNEYREGYKGRKYKIKNSMWFLISEDYVNSEDLQEHIEWIVHKINKIKNLPCYLKKKIQKIKLSKNTVAANNKIFIKFLCVWNPVEDHGGPILSPKVMNEIAQLNIEFSIETYFLYDISIIYSFMEAGQLLGVGQELKYEDWVRLLSYIKAVHHIPPSTLGSIYDTGDFRDDNGNLICNIKDYI